MRTLSTGQPSTLGSYYDNCKMLFGDDSPATKYFAQKISESPDGADEEVIAAESQMMYLIGSLLNGEDVP